MNKAQGIIIEIENGSAFVLTQFCDIIKITAKSDYMVGMNVSCHLSEETIEQINTVRNTPAQRHAVLGRQFLKPVYGVVIAVMLALLFPIISIMNPVYAWISIDINPGIELAVNKNYQVIGMRTFNNEATQLVDGLQLQDGILDDDIELIIDKASEMGFLTKSTQNTILVAATLRTRSTNNKKMNENVNALIAKINNGITRIVSESILVEFRFSEVPIRNEAQRSGLSIGRYMMMKAASENHVEISTSVASQMQIQELIRLGSIENDKSPENEDEITQPSSTKVVENDLTYETTEQIITPTPTAAIVLDTQEPIPNGTAIMTNETLVTTETVVTSNEEYQNNQPNESTTQIDQNEGTENGAAPDIDMKKGQDIINETIPDNGMGNSDQNNKGTDTIPGGPNGDGSASEKGKSK